MLEEWKCADSKWGAHRWAEGREGWSRSPSGVLPDVCVDEVVLANVPCC